MSLTVLGRTGGSRVYDDSHVFAPELIATLTSTADQFDRRYSRFRDDSLVPELWRNGKLSHPPAEIVRMLTYAREMYEVSEGTFDITVGNDLHRMGYGKRAITRDIDTSKLWDEIVLTPVEIILPVEVMLDFGGFGKGWLIADTMATILMLRPELERALGSRYNLKTKLVR